MEVQPVKRRRLLAKSFLLLSGIAIVVYSIAVFYYVKEQTFKGFYVFAELKVAKVFPQSEAALNGLRKGDKVIELNGQRVRSVADYLFLSGQLKPGQKSVVVVEREGERIPIEFTVEKEHPPLSSYIWLAFALATLVTGLIVYAKGPGDTATILFCLICVCGIGAFVGGANWHVLVNNAPLLSGFMLTGALLSPFCLHYALVFPHKKEIVRRHKWIIPLLYLPHLALFGVIEGFNIQAHYEFAKDRDLHSEFNLIIQLAYAELILIAAYLAAALGCIIHAYRATTSSEAEKQLKWIFWSTCAAAIPFAFAAYIAVSDFKSFAFGAANGWIMLGSFLVMGGGALAITRYRLMDIDLFINRSIVYFIVSGVVVFGYYVFVVGASWALSTITGDTSAVSSILYMLAIAVIFRPFSEMVQKLVDRFFYREKYEFQRMMLEVSTAISSILDLDQLLKRILDTLVDGLHIRGAAILLWNESGRVFERVAGQVSAAQPLLPVLSDVKMEVPATIAADTLLAQRLLTDKEVVAIPHPTPSSDTPAGRIAAEMRSYGVSIAIPLIFEDKVIGALLLGPKLSLDIYTSEDVRMLRTLGFQAAIAIHNATSYRTIQRLNAELADKIRKIEDQQQQILHLQKQLVNENRYLKEEIRQKYNFREIVGSSKAIKDVLKMVEKVANTQSVVLIRGESGTGKELIARAIHYNSDRRNGPFVKVNCAALSEGVLESELFGHERGAFTGAIRQKVGRFELASGGTIFLDEIGDIPLKTQVRLLRVLQEKEFERVGGNETIHVDVRVIASTHRNLEELIKDKHFREDLFYRLNVITLFIPPLRERKEDIYELAIHFLNKYNREVGKNLRYFDDEAMQLLINYDWPGNVRELENMIERAVVLGEGECVTAKDLPFGQMGATLNTRTAGGPRTLPEALDNYERERLRAAIEEFNGNRSAAARSLGLKRTTFLSKLKKYGLA